MSRSGRRVRGNGARSGILRRTLANFRRFLANRWRRSLQLRVVTSTLVLSIVVLVVLGFVVTSQITDRILDSKLRAATEEMDRARVGVERIIESGTDDSVSEQTQITQIRTILTDRGDGSENVRSSGTFDTVLLVPGSGSQQAISAGPVDLIPADLHKMVGTGQVAYRYVVSSGTNNTEVPTLIIGAPIYSGGGLELYLLYPMNNEQNTVALVRGTIGAGALVLLLLVVAIAMLITRQVVLPVRQASKIAAQFADGKFTERMPVRGEDDIARLAVSFNDMAESLSRQITQLEEFGSLQRQFTSDVSHELRTPLTTVRMASDMMYESRDELEPGLKRASELMNAELERFENLLTELLEISRHDAGVAELSPEKLDMAIPVNAAVNTVRHLAKTAKTELVVDITSEPILAEVDSRRVERVLRNLLANAIDHSEHRPVTLTMRTDGDSVAISVRDLGVGLRPGEEKLVFNRFWRSDPSRVRRSGGTGLGLAMSLEDARLHQGKLEAWGEPGRGANFRLTLPLVHGHKVLGSPLPLKPVDSVVNSAGRSEGANL